MIEIRYVQAKDEPFWYSLDKHLPKEEFLTKVREKRGYVLLEHERPVGLLRYNLFWDNTPFCTMLFIGPKDQKKGYGRCLMEYWEDDMKSQGYGMLLTSTQVDEQAQHFYRKLGYKDCGGLVIDIPGYAQPMELFMAKEIKMQADEQLRMEKRRHVMKILASTAQMKELDRIAIEEWKIPSLDLMERAAGAVAGKVLQITGQRDGERRIAIFCGPGNNGGDGIAAARLLMQEGCEVRVYLVGDRNKMTPDALAMEQKLLLAGKRLEDYLPDSPEQQEWIKNSTGMIDALFGVGLRRPVAGDFLSAVRQMNAVSCPVVSCDIPSGIDGDTGSILGEAVRADSTVTFTCSKYGLEKGDGRTCAGRVEVASIGIPEALVLRTLT